jgi:tyrosinase
MALCTGNIIVTRKNAVTMPSAEWDRLANALNNFKQAGGYDTLTEHHATAQLTLTLFPNETGTNRNVAHRGPAFFPWHRHALRELELALIDIQLTLYPNDPPVGMPYWEWNLNITTWRSSPIWTLVGGDGNPNNNYLINSGPFANWTSRIVSGSGFVSRAGIVRRFNTTRNMPNFGYAFNKPNYDSSPWREGAAGFRQEIEGKHNLVHQNIGGDMGPPTSPNDPIFWLHHCNVDRAWAIWQTIPTIGIGNFQPIRTSLPEEPAAPGPQGHNDIDIPVVAPYVNAAKPNNEALDWAAVDNDGNGYTYDNLVAPAPTAS